VNKEEVNRLNEVASKSIYNIGANAEGIKYGGKILSRFLRPGVVLEMGPAEGLMTEVILNYVNRANLTLLDGSEIFCKQLKSKFKDVDVVCSLFENFVPKKKFTTIVMGHVLEHVENPVEILKLASTWLEADGVIFSAVPNARSLHRQAAVHMGLLQAENQLNSTDIHHGHRRVYDPEKFRQEFIKAGLKIELFGGYWLKPVSNKQIEENWTSDMLQAFMSLGERYPDIAGEIYVIAKIK